LLSEILREEGDHFGLILIDCLTLWISNGLMAQWTEKKFLQERIAIVIEMIKSFGTLGTELTMTAYNKLGKIRQDEGNK
jgi:adenosyl cobinamide kinase/adenosyl cobinamide phosphate guanylyltransferase